MLKYLALASSIFSFNLVLAADDNKTQDQPESLNIQEILSGRVKGTGRVELNLENLEVFLTDVLHVSIPGEHQTSGREKFSRYTALFDETHVRTSLANSINFQQAIQSINRAYINLSDIKLDGDFNTIYTITFIDDTEGSDKKWQLPITIDKQKKMSSVRIVEGVQAPLYMPTSSPVLDQRADENDSVVDSISPASSEKIKPRSKSKSNGSFKKLFTRSDSSPKKESSSSSSSPTLPRSSSSTSSPSPQRKGSASSSPQLDALNKQLSEKLAKRSTNNDDEKSSGTN